MELTSSLQSNITTATGIYFVVLFTTSSALKIWPIKSQLNWLKKNWKLIKKFDKVNKNKT